MFRFRFGDMESLLLGLEKEPQTGTGGGASGEGGRRAGGVAFAGGAGARSGGHAKGLAIARQAVYATLASEY